MEAVAENRRRTLVCTVFALSRAEFGKLLADEATKWRKVVRAVNIRLE